MYEICFKNQEFLLFLLRDAFTDFTAVMVISSTSERLAAIMSRIAAANGNKNVREKVISLWKRIRSTVSHIWKPMDMSAAIIATLA